MNILETAFNQLLSNPINWVLAGVNLWIIGEILRVNENKVVPKHSDTIVLRDFTLKELRAFNGVGPNNPIYVAVSQRVYDVSRGVAFYGPGSAYGNFAGRDASRALAKHSFDESMFSDEWDNLSDLTESELNTMREWESHFATKYDHVGFLVQKKD